MTHEWTAFRGAAYIGDAAFRPDGETGRREGLKIPFPQGSPSSSLGPGISFLPDA